MKKSILAILILLLAGPVMAATVTITIVPRADCNGWAAINYAADANVRGFGLKIVASGDAANEWIVDVNHFKVGESTSSSKGFGIFFGDNGIDVNSSGGVDSYGIPVYDPCLPEAAGTGIGTNTVILGMGAVYLDGNQPPLSGRLCDVRVNKTCKLTATGHVLSGGTNGVIMENSSSPTLVLTGATNIDVFTLPLDHPSYAEWNSRGRPKCWTYLRNCRGDTNNLTETLSKYWVYTNDLNTLVAAWKKPLSLMTNPNWICADFNKAGETLSKYRVYTTDLNILVANWKSGATAGDCQNAYGN